MVILFCCQFPANCNSEISSRRHLTFVQCKHSHPQTAVRHMPECFGLLQFDHLPDAAGQQRHGHMNQPTGDRFVTVVMQKLLSKMIVLSKKKKFNNCFVKKCNNCFVKKKVQIFSSKIYCRQQRIKNVVNNEQCCHHLPAVVLGDRLFQQRHPQLVAGGGTTKRRHQTRESRIGGCCC